MSVALLLIVALAGAVGLVVLAARMFEPSQEKSGPQPSLGLRVDPTEDYQLQFHAKAVREGGRVSGQQARRDGSNLEDPLDDVRESAVEERQRRMDCLRVVREARRPRLTGELRIPLDASLSAWLPEKFVVLDLETTGLSPQMNEIIEIGAIRAALGVGTHATFQTLVIPQREITEEISRINGITQRMVDRDGRPADLSLREFVEFIGDLPLVTYNAPFDMGFLRITGGKHGIEIKNRCACALQMSRRAWPNLRSHRLPDLARWAGLPEDGTHRALGDCERALRIFIAAVSEIGQRVRWEYHPLDWQMAVQYNEKRDANRAFCVETRSLEETNLALAVSRYGDAMKKMYDYEADVDGRYADASILDRFTLCLWRSERYDELVEAVNHFAEKFPEAGSSLMAAVLRRSERAKLKLKTGGQPASREGKPATNVGATGPVSGAQKASSPNQPHHPAP